MKQYDFGLDISDKSIELISLVGKKGYLRVSAFAQAEIPAGVIERGRIVDADALVKVLVALLDAAFGTKRGRLSAGVSLPETVVYSKIFSLPLTLTNVMVGKAVALEAADALPIPIATAFTSFSVIGRTQTSQEVAFFAAERDVVRHYVDVLDRAGIKPQFLDSEALALSRALVSVAVTEPVLIADIGARTTNFSIVQGGFVRFSSSIMLGGDALTEVVEKKHGVSLAIAEDLRRRGGFDPTFEEGRLFLMMSETMNEIIEELRKTIWFYEKRMGKKVAAVLLAGGNSLTPQIVEYVGSNLSDVPVALGDPLKGLSLEGLSGKDRLSGRAILWGTAIGLALRMTGTRASPGIDLMPPKKRGAGLKDTLESIKNTFISITTMVTRPKKSAAPKQSSEEAAKPAVVESVSASSVAPTPAEKDYGHDIGVILGSAAEAKPAAATAAETPAAKPTPTVAPRRSIESILSGDGSVAARPVETARRRSVLPLFIMVLILVAATLAGIIMFVRKNGTPDAMGLWSRFSTPSDSVVPAETNMPETVNTVVVLATAATEGEQRPVLLTRVIETDVIKESEFDATGEAVAVGGKSTGMATIVNETSQNFNFVATTRLLSKEGVLFRMKTGSAIPANGSVTVEIAADVAGPSGDIAATTFTIPGLSAALQQQVYAKSDTAMTGGSGKAKAVSEADIMAAKEALTAELLVEAKANFASLLAEGEGLNDDLITSSEISAEAPAVGSAAATFTLKLSLRFRALLVPEGQVAPLLDTALQAAAPGAADDFLIGEPSFTVQAYDAVSDRAEVRVEAPISRP